MANEDIRGTVTDQSGNPVQGAVVEVTRAETDGQPTPADVVRTTTDSNGEYVISSHPEEDGTSLEWHVSAYYYDGSSWLPAVNRPGVAAALGSIPDSDILHARYDATELSLNDGDSVTTFPDETGGGNDLSGSASYQTGVINGNPVVRTDGVDDDLSTTFSQSFSEPYAIFGVFGFETDPGTDLEFLHDGGSDQEARLFSNDGEWGINQGSGLTGGTVDTNPHVFGTLWDSTDVLRIDGGEVISGSAGSASLSGFILGDVPANGFEANANFGEVLVYEQEPTVSDVESYLSNKWGITI